MGIKGFYQFIKKKCPETIKICPISDLKGKNVAIDIFGYLYKYKLVNSKTWIYCIANFLESLKVAGITPICVFDGAPPKEKMEEVASRKQVRADTGNKVKELQKDVAEYHTSKAMSELLATEMKKYHDDNVVSLEHFQIQQVEAKLIKMDNQSNGIDQEDLVKFKAMLVEKDIGMELDKSLEAEKNCCKMVLDGIADFVLSFDSDVCAYTGTTQVIRDIDTKKKEYTLVNVTQIVTALGFENHKQLTDFCIMCGTDYNDNIPLIGPVKSLDLIKKYKDIEGVEKSGKFKAEEIAKLNYIIVREIFRLGVIPKVTCPETPS